MRWPWVSRDAHEELRAYARSLESALARHRVEAGEERSRYAEALVAERTRFGEALAGEQTRYDALLDKYHALRVAGANPKEPDRIVPPPKMPPRPIMNAIRVISPREDATFAANMKLYRDHQEEADQDPDAFAERIKRGRLEPEPVATEPVAAE